MRNERHERAGPPQARIGAGTGGHGRRRAAGLRRHWPLLRKIFFIAFALLVIGLLADQARHVEWDKVLGAVQAYTWPVLLRAAGLSLLSYLIYSCFDLLAIPYLGHMIPPLRVMAVGIVAYAFNLNMGSLVGSVGFRFRLYLRLGLAAGEITRIIGLSLTTNWLGYLWVAGGIFAWGGLPIPDNWSISGYALRGIGVAMVAAAAAYVALCGLSRRRAWSVRGHEIELPAFKIAVAQSLLGGACWVSIGLVVWSLMRHDVSFPFVLGVLLLSGIAGAVTHIPGGLGVVEAVFVAMLGGKVPHYEIIGTLLAYRAVYYLGPFALAAVLYFFLEARLPKLAEKDEAEAEGDAGAAPPRTGAGGEGAGERGETKTREARMHAMRP
ncbi:lysylphosphatidylglycerol synthase domain-containing protein [Bordetella genomosp. 10]|nr:lysylphosphatidylglycerol synthase domain-containing protein [Bordetella genomosp. 10]